MEDSYRKLCDKMEGRYHDLSIRLYQILDLVGASDEMREKRKERTVSLEVLLTPLSHFFDDNPYDMYVFGSSIEGTTTAGLNSDLDMLTCLSFPVVESISESPQHGISLLMVTDESTKPGYCKLQVVLDGVPQHVGGVIIENLENDQHHRLCMKHMFQINEDFRERNGPAITKYGVDGNGEIDRVVAFKCKNIPSIAQSWVKRVNSCKRLNTEQREMMKESGCFFVGVNHPSSQNGPIEWRLSFSLQERELMTSLNPTQHKCYVLLKMIKKDIIHKKVPQSVSSYHLKTCLLYAIENTTIEFWTRGNFLECVFLCLNLLLRWVKERYCPNYFIPEENMFDRLEITTLQRVQVVLEDIVVDNWCGCLWSLTCDDIENVLKDVMFGNGAGVLRKRHGEVTLQSFSMYRSIWHIMGHHVRMSLRKCDNMSSFQSLKTLHGFHRYLQQMKCAAGSTEEDTRMAVCYFSPHISLSITQYIVSVMLSTRHAEALRILSRMAKHYISESKESGVMSVDLIVATYYLNTERYEQCESILYGCETFLKSRVISLCSCNIYKGKQYWSNQAVNELILKFRSGDFPYREFARTSTTGCLIFPPNQANIVPAALHYEMYRSINTPAGSRHKIYDIWFDRIVVDSTVYLYFLQYLLFTKTNKPVCKQDAIDNLIHVIHTDENIGHRETAYNLLGWIYKRENQPDAAIECFLESWRIRPNHNAAKWHMLEMILELGRP